ncbi:oxidoreductase molybdopterin binding protein [Salinarchaeum sp. Harcht-Bsk1]|uniref:molybdopterin-dependent oxidoreductase n=1 Tax=Salinarchaeum sp. Harcht-Bsk1 TaxID=1333523 RepID=UPI000342377B|nr:molybdopterin-dependent oxidoreductase [Salinarchaeum sp. Harcht-Bsk1]AGN01922.1 oxidoreductase molybdopterin binding protein [Salinarchaeum sp. Harcht-Bsk1]
MDRTRLDPLLSPLRRAWEAVQPPPRLVDWTLFAIVVFETVSGLYSFTVADHSGWWLFWAHRIAGLTFAVFLAFKLARVRDRLTDPDRWLRSMALSVLTAIAAIGALATGIVWVGGSDVRISYWTLLSIHVAFGLLLVPLLIAHLTSRFRLPRPQDLDRRRTTLQYSALFVGGAVAYRGQEFANRLLGTPGEDRRFTGSQVRKGEGNDAFPLTSWVADDPDPIDRDSWTLDVRGAVDSELTLEYSDVDSDAEIEALLDCTSGWYTVQDWRGIRVGDLLEEVGPASGAEYVRFVSVTGYRWSLPIEEARDALLATHVGGERLSHGHGAPIRLVAPGRRGFQWVKWVVRVDVRKRSDPAQWLVTLISGFD